VVAARAVSRGVVESCASGRYITCTERCGLRQRDISYGTYIYHMFVIDLMLQFEAGGGAGSVVVAVVFAIGLAVVSWSVVERPFLKGKRGGLREAG
jgi:hypothetical protein